MLANEILGSEKPREKLQNYGIESLSTSELVAIIIETETKNESVLTIANRIIMKFKHVAEMQYASLEELQLINGIGLAKASKIMAAVELGKRISLVTEREEIVIRCPDDAVKLVMPELAFLFQEHFQCIFLNTKNQVIYRQTIFVGGLNASIVHPREVFRLALRKSAASLMCFHNHPSGDPSPSSEDLLVTKRLVEAGNIIGITLLDHIIIGKNKYISLKEKGYF
ncbi:RadC family protein [Listeria seeligeri]|uniref:RadC family protein n=1 Tax=Listeria seeligeri TaxID=1640 RepID=UPI0018894FFD|nr:DNA repair protein RadC [Listeria seeligeri]MBF2629083.1 DNA repair protein RadC [Listeria seeligeri]